MTGLTCLPKRNFVITFRRLLTKSYTNGKISLYTIEAVVRKNGMELEPRMWRTAYGYLLHEFDRIHSEIGTLFNVTLKVDYAPHPVIVLDNPNLPLFNMEALKK